MEIKLFYQIANRLLCFLSLFVALFHVCDAKGYIRTDSLFSSTVINVKNGKNSIDSKLHKVEESWDSLWIKSDFVRHINTTENGDCYIRFSPDYMRERKLLWKTLKRSVNKFADNEIDYLRSFIKNQLANAIRSGIEEDIISLANLYLYVLPKEDIDQKLPIYTNILMPIYYNARNSSDLYYLYKLLCSYKNDKEPNEKLDIACLRIKEQYDKLIAFLPEEDMIKGIWVSKETGKNSLPKIILSIRESDGHYYGVFSQFSSYAKENLIRSSVISNVFGIDSSMNYVMQFRHEEFKEGISEDGVRFITEMIDATGQAVAKAIVANVPSVGGDIATMAIQIASTLIMAGVASSSKNLLTNSYLNVVLTHTDNLYEICADYNLESERRSSSRPLEPQIYTDSGTIHLYKLNPDSEIIFVGKRMFPITEMSRQPYLTPEYYKVFKDYKATCSPIFSLPLVATPYNILQKEKLTKTY